MVNARKYPAQIYDCSDNNGKLQAYHTVMQQMGYRQRDSGNALSFEDFLRGGFMLSFNFCPDACAGKVTHRPKEGKLDLVIKFNKDQELKKNLTLYTLAHFDASFQLDGERNCHVEYTVQKSNTSGNILR